MAESQHINSQAHHLVHGGANTSLLKALLACGSADDDDEAQSQALQRPGVWDYLPADDRRSWRLVCREERDLVARELSICTYHAAYPWSGRPCSVSRPAQHRSEI